MNSISQPAATWPISFAQWRRPHEHNDPDQRQMIREAMQAIAAAKAGPVKARLRQDEAHDRCRRRRLADAASSEHHRG